MALQQMWIHGNNVVMRFPGGKGDPVASPHTPRHQMDGVLADPEGLIEWSDVVGLHGPAGVTFFGRGGGNTNQFFTAVPTPAVREETPNTAVWGTYLRARLTRVLLRFSTDPGVTITGMKVFDGARDLVFPFPPMGLTSDHSNDWAENINYFVHTDPPEIYTGVCVIFDVRFDAAGNITFNSVGCDFWL